MFQIAPDLKKAIQTCKDPVQGERNLSPGAPMLFARDFKLFPNFFQNKEPMMEPMELMELTRAVKRAVKESMNEPTKEFTKESTKELLNDCFVL